MTNKRVNNKLPTNLPQLQNCIKRDANGYKDEFNQQYDHYRSLLQVFQFNPSANDKNFQELVMFISHVSHCFPKDLSEFPNELMSTLKLFSANLNPDVRMTLCRALILLRNKSLITPQDMLSLFFELLRCNDKNLRQFLKQHIITDIKNVNSKHKNAKMNTVLQNFMFSMLKDSNKVAAKISLEIMIELYNKNVWKDAKTVNVIASSCFSKITKILVTGLTFFLGNDEVKEDSDSDDSDSDDDNQPNALEVAMANRVNKKSNKRKKLLARTKKAVKKAKKNDKVVSFNFSAIHLIHDPQTMAERLFKSLQTCNERFEVKLMFMNLISRLVGIHELILLNFYPFIQRFIQSHQREVTKILQYTAQAAHELVPPDVIEPLLKQIANNFITERNSSEVMAVGINSIREVCSRCPLVMTEDLLQDLVEYKTFRDKNVSMAAKSLIQLFRLKNPHLLKKKDRSKPTEANLQIKAKQYGEVVASDFIDGVETLNETVDSNIDDNNDEPQDDDDDSEGWINVNHSEDEDSDGFIDVSDSDDEDESGDEESKEDMKTSISDPKEKAALISSSRILTQEEFRKVKAIQLSKQISAAKPRKFNKNAKSDEPQDVRQVFEPKEIVPLNAIERLYKKSRADKEMRLESVREGREGRDKFGAKKGKSNPFSSKNKKENLRNKNFQMIKHKIKTTKKKSFKEKQVALKNRLLKKCK
ncbi:protein SDA1 homolog [Oppia nitens]|uniref:protein SDA1 homolog n=1 Tax=Oppia nitens TaxID=1686743 RepID=UPI0023DBED3C|nr:protein SDA1 homolog [Oppia nitens]